MLTLTPDELRAITGCARARGQRAWLAERGIPHREVGRRILVSRAAVERWLSGVDAVAQRGPDLAMVM